jgi:peroxiredoxin
MLKRLSLLSLLLVLPLASGCHLTQSAHAEDVSSIPVGYGVGQRAPAFDLLSVGQSGSVRLEDLKGKPVIVNFYCGCNFCGIVGREWVKNKDKVGNATVLAVMTNHWTYNPTAVREFRGRTGWSWPVLADMESQTASSFNALTCPRVFVIDAHGIIRYASAEGASDEKKLVADALAAARAS